MCNSVDKTTERLDFQAGSYDNEHVALVKVVEHEVLEALWHVFPKEDDIGLHHTIATRSAQWDLVSKNALLNLRGKKCLKENTTSLS